MLVDKVAIVTGASRGIGRVISLALAKEGINVALVARSVEDLTTVKNEIIDAGGRAEAFVADITQEAEVEQMVAAVVRHYGKLDILINNAGMVRFKEFMDTTEADWLDTMAVNAKGPFLLGKACVPYLKKQKVSSIISIASVLGFKAYREHTAYAASKHALVGLSKVMALELQEFGIRVHVIYPGGTNTDMRWEDEDDRLELIQPESIAEAVTFLLSMRGNSVVDEVYVRRANTTPFQ